VAVSVDVSVTWMSADWLQVESFMSWLNPKGVRELQLLKQLKVWQSEIQEGMRRRRIVKGLVSLRFQAPTYRIGREEEGLTLQDMAPETDEPRRRPVRKAAGAEEEKEGYLGWRVSRSIGCVLGSPAMGLGHLKWKG
jgi:bromodomain adjacent to zinc finger domain protein 1A